MMTARLSVIAVIGLLLCAPPADAVAAAEPVRLLRLHVAAHSDANQDQALKLEVRDRILEYLKPALEEAEDFFAARRLVIARCGRVAELAREVVRDAGKDQVVSADVVYRQFPHRTYGELEVPAGKYWALTVDIGSGEGENWWCVLFPVLCVTAAEDVSSPHSDESFQFRFAFLQVLSDFIRKSGDVRADAPLPDPGPSLPRWGDSGHSLP